MPVLLAQSIFRVWMLGYERYNLSSYQRNSCYAFLHYTCSISNKYWLTVYYVPHTVLGAEDSAGWQGNGNIELYSAFVLRCISASQKKWEKIFMAVYTQGSVTLLKSFELLPKHTTNPFISYRCVYISAAEWIFSVFSKCSFRKWK